MNELFGSNTSVKGPPLVSVIVPAYNEELILERNLDILCDTTNGLRIRKYIIGAQII